MVASLLNTCSASYTRVRRTVRWLCYSYFYNGGRKCFGNSSTLQLEVLGAAAGVPRLARLPVVLPRARGRVEHGGRDGGHDRVEDHGGRREAQRVEGDVGQDDRRRLDVDALHLGRHRLGLLPREGEAG